MEAKSTAPKQVTVELFFDVVEDDGADGHDTSADMSWVDSTVEKVTEVFLGALKVVGWPGSDGTTTPQGARMVVKIGDPVDAPGHTMVVSEPTTEPRHLKSV